MHKVACTQPRPWSSYTNVYQTKDDQLKMNSVEDLPYYRENIYCSPTLSKKTSATTYDFPEHPPKKDKKWSFGSLFRRKKKEETDSSSDEEAEKKGYFSRKKKKPEKRKKTKHRATFDHIVPQRDTLYTNGYFFDEAGILSDPTGGFGTYQGRTLSRTPQQIRKLPKMDASRDVSNRNDGDRACLGSADSLLKKTRKDVAKIRAEARRGTYLKESSSDDESQRSSSSKMRSDENISRSMNKKSRAARTERYIRRLSKDEEGYYSNVKTLKSDVENGYYHRKLLIPEAKKDKSYSPTSNFKVPNQTSDFHQQVPGCHQVLDSHQISDYHKVLDYHQASDYHIVSDYHQASDYHKITDYQPSGLSTPSHYHNNNTKRNSRENVSSPNFMKPPISSTNLQNRYGGSLTSNESKNFNGYQRSFSYDADINRTASPDIKNSSPEVIHAQLPIMKPNQRFRNLSLMEQPRIFMKQKQPPPPPPRDPWRILNHPQSTETQRPMSYCFDRNLQNNKRTEGKPHSFNWKPNFRSTSEDHLPSETSPVPFYPRPASATSEHPKQRIIRKTIGGIDASEHYQYLADRSPRSRRPICIQEKNEIPSKNEVQSKHEIQSKNDVQPEHEVESKHEAQSRNRVHSRHEVQSQNESKKAIDFWKKMDEDMNRVAKITEQKINPDYWKKKDNMEKKPNYQKSSPQMFTASTQVRTNIFLPINDNSNTFKPIVEPNDVDVVDATISTNVQSRSQKPHSINDNDVDSISNEIISDRKSSNLEDALDELEAIYNSLRLGDEDLLERAEEREKSIAAKKIMEANLESYPGWGPVTRGAMSDSSFNYEPFDSLDSPKRKKFLKKSKHPDRKNDDMALRKLHKERNHTISDPKEVISSVSYLLASPVHQSNDVNEVESVKAKNNQKEPDVTFDDVVFRTIKHANNTLKVSDPQPPFGIPVGPVLPAPNSDYLHAVPEKSPQFSHNNKRIPDVVKDDLAFRNLRKDSNKEPVLPALTVDDVVNNNNNNNTNTNLVVERLKLNYGNNNSIKKKRAIRSLSANIYNLVQNDPFAYTSFYEEEQEPKAFEKPNLSDIADAMEIARQILKEKEEKINATRRAFLSDTEAKYKKKDATEQINESRLNFLNSMKSKQEELQQKVLVNVGKEEYLQTKPPRGVTPDKKSSKETSPGDTNKEGPPDEYHRSSLDDLLTAFAMEAQEASQRIADEIRDKSKIKLEESDDRKLKSPALVRKNSSPKLVEIKEDVPVRERSVDSLDKSKTIEETRSDDDKRVEKMAPLATAELMPVEEDVEDQLEEQLERIASEGEEHKSVANLVLFCEAKERAPNPIEEIGSASDHDYVNLNTDAELEETPSNSKLANPLSSSFSSDNSIKLEDTEEVNSALPFQEPKADLMAGFQELKNIESDDTNPDQSVPKEGEKACVLNSSALTREDKECAFLTESFIELSESGNIISYVSGCDILVNRESPQSTNDKINDVASKPCDTDCLETAAMFDRLMLNGSPTSSGFHSNSISDNDPIEDDQFDGKSLTCSGPLHDLKSPQLVLDCINNKSNNPDDSSIVVPSTSKENLPDNLGSLDDDKDINRYRNLSKFHEENRKRSLNDDTLESTSAWCIDPLALAFACSYGFACTYQIVSVDFIAILGLFLLLLSFIAALVT